MLNEWENLRVLFFLKLIIFEPPSDPLEGLTLRGLDSEDLRLAAEGRECAENGIELDQSNIEKFSWWPECANPNDWFPLKMHPKVVSTPQIE